MEPDGLSRRRDVIGIVVELLCTHQSALDVRVIRRFVRLHPSSASDISVLYCHASVHLKTSLKKKRSKADPSQTRITYECIMALPMVREDEDVSHRQSETQRTKSPNNSEKSKRPKSQQSPISRYTVRRPSPTVLHIDSI